MSTQSSGAQDPSHQSSTGQQPGTSRTVFEWVEVGGDQLVSTVRRLVAEGNVRRVVLRSSSGRELLSFPVTAGAVVGGVTVVAAPVLAAVGVIAAMVTSVTVGIERSGTGPGDGADPAAGAGAEPAAGPQHQRSGPSQTGPVPSAGTGSAPAFPPSDQQEAGEDAAVAGGGVPGGGPGGGPGPDFAG